MPDEPLHQVEVVVGGHASRRKLHGGGDLDERRTFVGAVEGRSLRRRAAGGDGQALPDRCEVRGPGEVQGISNGQPLDDPPHELAGVADDHAVVREGLLQPLDDTPGRRELRGIELEAVEQRVQLAQDPSRVTDDPDIYRQRR